MCDAEGLSVPMIRAWPRIREPKWSPSEARGVGGRGVVVKMLPQSVRQKGAFPWRF